MGMIALIPDPADAALLAVEGGDPVEEMHLTLAYLGDDDEAPISPEDHEFLRQEVIGLAKLERPQGAQGTAGPLEAQVFAHAQFNPGGVNSLGEPSDPCMVYVLNGDFALLLERARGFAHAVGAPDPFPTFVPHVTAGYGLDATALSYTGPVQFTAIRLAVGDIMEDYPMQPAPLTAATEEAPAEIPVEFPVIVVEGMRTDDGRFIEPGSLTHRALPLPILAQNRNPDGGEGHDGAYTIGLLRELERVDGPSVISKETGEPFPPGTFVWRGRGGVDATHPEAGMARKGYLRGNSVDLVATTAELTFPLEDSAPEGESEDGRGSIIIGGDDDEMRLTSGKIAATTLVPIPAFADGYVIIDGQQMVAPEGEALVASAPMWRSAELGDDTCTPCIGAEPVAPMLAGANLRTVPAPEGGAFPIEYFQDPQFSEATPLYVDDETGRVYGHLALWGTCHTGFAGTCTMAPRSKTGYRAFHLGAVRTVRPDGSKVDLAVGHITLGAGHADGELALRPAIDHYDNTATAVVDLVVGEDQHGIWGAGVLRPGVTAEQVHALRASPISGDWRPLNGKLELVAALAVNTPGFPVPRAMVASGAVVSLVAAGVVPSGGPMLSLEEKVAADQIAAAAAAQLAEGGPGVSAELAERRVQANVALAELKLKARRQAAMAALVQR